MTFTYLASDEMEIRAGRTLIGYIVRTIAGDYIACQSSGSSVGRFSRQCDAVTALMLAGSPF